MCKSKLQPKFNILKMFFNMYNIATVQETPWCNEGVNIDVKFTFSKVILKLVHNKCSSNYCVRTTQWYLQNFQSKLHDWDEVWTKNINPVLNLHRNIKYNAERFSFCCEIGGRALQSLNQEKLEFSINKVYLVVHNFYFCHPWMTKIYAMIY